MWEYRARLINVHDGDTVTLEMDTGFGGRQQEAIRLLGVFAPELSQPGGNETRDFVVAWMRVVNIIGTMWPLLVTTLPTLTSEPTERQSFTRYIGSISDIQNHAVQLNTAVNAFLATHPEWGPGVTVTT
jgi:hypothetical protein